MLRQQDVGHRIVVRRIVGIREGRPLFSDALGELVELSETHLTLATAQGPLRVPRGRGAPGQAGAAGPPADRRRGGRRWSWPPTRPGRPRYAAGSATGCCARPRAGPAGPTRRCRSATRTARSPAAVDAVERWYADRGQPADDQHAAAARRAGRRRAGRARLGQPARRCWCRPLALAARAGRRRSGAGAGPGCRRSSWPPRRRTTGWPSPPAARAACRTPPGTCSPPWTRSASPTCTPTARWSPSAGARSPAQGRWLGLT